MPQFQFDGHNQTLSALEGLPLFSPVAAARLDVVGEGATAASAAADGAPAASAAVGLSTCHIWPYKTNELEFKSSYEVVWPLHQMVQTFSPLPPPPQIHLRPPSVAVALGGGFLRLRGGGASGRYHACLRGPPDQGTGQGVFAWFTTTDDGQASLGR